MTYEQKLSTGADRLAVAGAVAMTPPLLLAAGAADAAPKHLAPPR